MNELLRYGLVAFTSLLAIVNPLSAVPIFVALTGTYDAAHRAAALRRAVLTAVLVLWTFAALGTYILSFFGITTHAFQIAGGIIFFAIGWDMLQAKRSRVKTTQEEEEFSAAKDDVGIIPLGIPTLAGPGAITTVIALTGQADGPVQIGAVFGAVVLVLLLSWTLLAAAPAVTRRVGTTGMNVMTRIMGLLVMVIGAQFIINGLSVVALDILARAS
ncbi:MAG: MarC family protein [Gemmatimonadota bacterium]